MTPTGPSENGVIGGKSCATLNAQVAGLIAQNAPGALVPAAHAAAHSISPGFAVASVAATDATPATPASSAIETSHGSPTVQLSGLMLSRGGSVQAWAKADSGLRNESAEKADSRSAAPLRSSVAEVIQEADRSL